MNLSSDQVRERFKAFNRGYFGRANVAKSALLRDTGYHINTPDDLKMRVKAARKKMASILGVRLADLQNVHSGNNGRFDCDNYTILGDQILKAMWDAECRKNGDTDSKEYAHWPFARLDIPHTQGLCLTCLTSEGFYIVEWITGEIFTVEEINPEIYLIG